MSYNPGASGIAGAADVALSNPVNDQSLVYDDVLDKWRNKSSAIAMQVVVWDSTNDVWPARPVDALAGMVTYNSTNDVAATPPADALSGDLWAKALL